MTDIANESDYLKNYDPSRYTKPLVTVDVVIFTLIKQQLCVLLIERDNHPAKGKSALPGGFVKTGEDDSLEAAAYRKLKEKTGISSPYLEQLGTFGNSLRDPRGWSLTVVYFALVNVDSVQLPASSANRLYWQPLPELNTHANLAFDHQEIIQAARSRLQAKVRYTNLPVHLMPTQFTLTELQSVFETLLGRKVEKKSFRRRVLEAGVIEETGHYQTGHRRPAMYYRARPGEDPHIFARSLDAGPG